MRRIAAWSVCVLAALSLVCPAAAQVDSPVTPNASLPAAPTQQIEIDPYDPGYTWGDTTVDTALAFVNAEKAFARSVEAELGVTFNLVETDYFLFYTDLSEREAYEWQRVLDLMYERVSSLLGIPDGINVFRGKATVFLFADKRGFVEFEQRFYNHRVSFEAGICHQHGTGEVRIAFYRIDHERAMRQLMVHEAAHGVVHRYRSPNRVPDWINEGIAEWTAFAVLNFVQPFRHREAVSKRAIVARGNRLGEAFWQDGNFAAEDYGAALGLTKVLLRKGRPAFHDFIGQIKDGQSYEAAMQDIYGYGIDRLVALYGRTLNIRDLRP
ncbi:MAG: hypothetical protein AAF823_06390 [Planctomycetota bacterium]